MRRTHYTILTVCEGDAEEQLVCVIRDLYLPRNCGTTLHRKNARGHGGAGALRLALELQQSSVYDCYAILADTDRHWGQDERDVAARNTIVAIEQRPCIEAVLLHIDGQTTYAQTRDNKAAFRDRYGDDASRDGLIRRKFTRQMFDAARNRVEALDQLLRLIRC
jgi:hypothetical protein